MKYFLTEANKLDKIKENFGEMANRNNQKLATPTEDDVIVKRASAVAMAKTIPTDNASNVKLI